MALFAAKSCALIGAKSGRSLMPPRNPPMSSLPAVAAWLIVQAIKWGGR